MEKCGKKLCKRRKKDLTGPTLLEISDLATLEPGLAHVVGLSDHEHQFQLHKAPMKMA
jgi:hypothetical protein